MPVCLRLCVYMCVYVVSVYVGVCGRRQIAPHVRIQSLALPSLRKRHMHPYNNTRVHLYTLSHLLNQSVYTHRELHKGALLVEGKKAPTLQSQVHTRHPHASPILRPL